MSGRPEFMQYTSYYDVAKKNLTEGPDALSRQEIPPPVELYDRLNERGLMEQLIEGDPLRWAIMDAERDWYLANKPYYKVYPEMVTQLLNASLNIDSKYLKMPHRAFTVLTSPKHPFTDLPVHATLVLALHRKDAWIGEGLPPEELQEFLDSGPSHLIAINHEFYHHGRRLAAGIAHLHIHDGQMLEEALTNRRSDRVKRIDPEVELAAPLEDRASAMTDLFRLVLAVALFGISQHELVCPDLSRRQQEKYDRAVRRGDAEAADRLRKKATGWTVGKDVRLPNWVKQGNKDGKSGRELTHAHIRRGHMRMQAYGSGMSLRKLIFIEPLWVRPDLPVGPSRGYEIKGE